MKNRLVIEQASVIAAFKQESYNNKNFGTEIAKYLELRLNTIEPKVWKVNFINEALNIINTNRGIEKRYLMKLNGWRNRRKKKFIQENSLKLQILDIYNYFNEYNSY